MKISAISKKKKAESEKKIIRDEEEQKNIIERRKPDNSNKSNCRKYWLKAFEAQLEQQDICVSSLVTTVSLIERWFLISCHVPQHIRDTKFTYDLPLARVYDGLLLAYFVIYK